MFEGKKILVTGGTGSLGQALTKRLLDEGAETIRIFSRNENKQVSMEEKFIQDNVSYSKKNVLRGLHFQKNKRSAMCGKNPPFNICQSFDKDSK